MENNREIFKGFKIQFKKVFGGEYINRFRTARELVLSHAENTTKMLKYISEYYHTSITDLYKLKGYDLLQMFETLLNDKPKE